MGSAMLSNPYKGLENWFEPEREIIIVNSAEEALERYRYLLSHDNEREAMGRAARERVLKEHTFQHRAQTLKKIVEEYI